MLNKLVPKQFFQTIVFFYTFGTMLNKLVPKPYKILGYQIYAFDIMSTNLVSKPRFNMFVINIIVCHKLFQKKHCLLTKE